MTDLLILTKYLQGGGAEVVLREIYENMPEDIDAKLVVIFNTVSPEDIEKYNPILLNYNVKKRNIISIIIMVFKITLSYTKILNKYKPRLSLGFGDIECYCNQIASFLTRTRQIQSYRNNVSSHRDFWIQNTLTSIHHSLNRVLADKIILNSNDNKKLLSSKYKIPSEKIVVIYNPKNISQIRLLSNEKIVEPFFQTEEPIILTAGRLSFEKGHLHLLRIFADINKNISCKLVICGEGPLREKLERLAKELHIEEKVLFSGWCNNPYKYMKKSNIFVFPSLSEGLPNALIEAMICGCPIVSADCDFGPREILENGRYGYLSKRLDGVILNANDPLTDAEKDMRDKLIILLTSQTLQKELSEKSLIRSEIFDREILLHKYYSEFRHVLSQNK